MEGTRVKYLLDTAPWINAVTLPETVPARIRRLLATSDKKGLCRISLLESAILHRLGRLQIEGTLMDFLGAGLSEDLDLLDLTPAIAARTNDFSRGFTGDPFDRTIIATAAVLNLTLITTDTAIRDLAACAVEYYPFKPARFRPERRPPP
jgi:PIN domain nuclease of toxin-antitoxin system